jgi:1,4-alpha-glucan branching enzyme
VKLREAVQTGRVIFEHDRNCNGAIDYLALAKELIPSLKNEQLDISEFTPTKQFLQALFKLHAPEAKNVYLAGSFNNWAIDSASMMKRLDDGTWLKELPLPNGTYHYKFVVDGKWVEDPANSSTESDGLGGKNSLITINTQTS